MHAKLYFLEPEVAGDLGAKTTSANLPLLQSGEAAVRDIADLEYEINLWSGDELLTGMSVYIVTQRLAEAIREAELTGARFTPVEISTSDQWKLFYPHVQIPPFERLIPEGRIEFTTGKEARLLAAERGPLEDENDEEPLLGGRFPMRGGGRVVSWSGHDACLGTRVDASRPRPPRFEGISLAPDGLVVSERFLRLLDGFTVENCTLEELLWAPEGEP